MTASARARPAERRLGEVPQALPVQVMGILNVTPDSFSDGGRYVDVGPAVAQARRLVAEGADILDIGAESTRPGHVPVSAETELHRLLPVLDAVLQSFAETAPIRISVDTQKAAVASAVLARGVGMVNDIWGFQGDAALPRVVAQHGAEAILMHNRRDVDPNLDIVDDMRRFFERSLAIAASAGVASEKVILDPGIGFGKTLRQQVEALAGVATLIRSFGRPVLVGVSRKSFLGQLMGAANDNRLAGTLAANLAARASGASLFRVHDVAEHCAAFRVFEAVERVGL